MTTDTILDTQLILINNSLRLPAIFSGAVNFLDIIQCQRAASLGVVNVISIDSVTVFNSQQPVFSNQFFVHRVAIWLNCQIIQRSNLTKIL